MVSLIFFLTQILKKKHAPTFYAVISDMYLAHRGPALRQGQWNVVKLGNPTHAGQCKQQRFKNIRIEAVDPTAPKTIPIMTDGVIHVSFN